MMLATAVAVAGCDTPSQRGQARVLARAALADAAGLPESAEKEALVDRLGELGRVLGDVPKDEPAGSLTARQWYEAFGPVRLAIYYSSTKLVDLDGDGHRETLQVGVGLEDRFGDPVKAFGAFRIETFNYQIHSLENRGSRIADWYVRVESDRDIKRYYNSFDRCFHLPLAMSHGFQTDRAVIQVMYYYPDGSGSKLIDRRVVKVDQLSGR
jgi:hypothetical protein